MTSSENTNFILYKKAFDRYEIDELIGYFENSIKQQNTFSNISNGVRTRKECLTNSFVTDRLQMILRDYLGEIVLSANMRLYMQTCGDIKPHKDVSLYGDYIYTCLIYLSDNFEGGNLSLKIKRSDFELKQCDFHLKHKVFTLIPQIGRCVIFHKDILHYANEVINGSKLILLVDIGLK